MGQKVYRVAINGYGRIGQAVLRAYFESPSTLPFEIVAINELADADTIAYLTKFDTTHGRFPGRVEIREGSLVIDDQVIELINEPDIHQLPWDQLDVDLVMECTGVHGKRKDGESHISRGAGRVLYSEPADPEVDQTIVYGINHDRLSSADEIVSSASCTTNCIVPVIHALHEAFAIKAGTLTTIHSMMNDQPTIDAYHHHDLRRTRSAVHNLVPVNTALSKGIARILPELKGKVSASAIRVPTINVSAIDMTLQTETSATIDEVNQAIKSASESHLQGIMTFTEQPVASSDFNHDRHSAIVDLSQTQVGPGPLIKLLVWFDNEWGFANRMWDVSQYWFDMISGSDSDQNESI